MPLSLSGTTGIVTGNIAPLNITTATIADSNVTTAKIADGNITVSKLASNLIPNVCSVYRNTNQNINTGVFNRVQLNASTFDTGSFFDTTTNYRFLPTVAGYYNIYGNVAIGSSGAGQRIVSIYKNGSEYRKLSVTTAITGTSAILGGSALVSFNGSSDYAELWTYQDSTATQTITAANFDAYFVRGL
jgi:hypothetical protein